MDTRKPFCPSYNPQTVVLSAGIQSADIIIPREVQTVRVTNIGAAGCYVRVGYPGMLATANDLYVANVTPNRPVMFTKDLDDTVFKALSPVGTTIVLETGERGL